jgi:hypothetical protein
LRTLLVRSARRWVILDGGIVVLEPSGWPGFSLLQ